MKSITIDVPSNGLRVELSLRSGSATGQAIVVFPDEVELRLALSEPVPSGIPPAPSTLTDNHQHRVSEAKKPDTDYVAKRLLKLRPTTKKAAVNSIKAMSQFGLPTGDEQAVEVFNDVCKQEGIRVDANGKIRYPNRR